MLVVNICILKEISILLACVPVLYCCFIISFNVIFFKLGIVFNSSLKKLKASLMNYKIMLLKCLNKGY